MDQELEAVGVDCPVHDRIVSQSGAATFHGFHIYGISFLKRRVQILETLE